MEYERLRFIKWFGTHPFARNLQRKNRLILTPKAILLVFLSLLELILFILLLNLFLTKNLIILFIATLLLVQFISPLFLVIALLLTDPTQLFLERRLARQAKAKLSKSKDIKIVAIAGSYGKTSTKNILYTLLWKDFIVVKTPKSFNTLVSIAKTIIEDLKPNTQVFIVEMDTYKRGDLAKLARFVNPQIGIMTAIGPQHLERFGNMDKLAEAQFELVDQIKDGLIFLNSKDRWSMRLLRKQKNRKKIVLFGGRFNDTYGTSSIRQKEEGLEFELFYKNEKVKIQLPLFGDQHVLNFLAAAAVANVLGLSLQRIQERAKLILPTEHRLEIKQVNGVTLIDNTYNTNPAVSKESLKILKEYKGRRRIFITPGYVELGKESENENISLMKNSAKVADEIILVGENSRKTLIKGLERVKYPKKKIHFAKDTKSAFEILFSIAGPSDLALFENDLPDQYF